MSARQRNIVSAGVTANAMSRITVAHTPDQYVMLPNAIGSIPYSPVAKWYVKRIPGNNTSANALALSQENLRFLSCQGQINRKARPPFDIDFFPSRVAEIIA